MARKGPGKAGERTGMTDKQALFLKAKAENPGMTDREAAKRAGYTDATAKNPGKNIANRCKTEMQEALEDAGVTKELIAKKVREGTEAYSKKFILVKDGIEKDKEGKSKSAHIAEKVTIDWRSRKDYLDLSTKIRGDIVQRVEQDNYFPEGVPLVLSPADDKRIGKELGTVFSASKGKKKTKKKGEKK